MNQVATSEGTPKKLPRKSENSLAFYQGREKLVIASKNQLMGLLRSAELIKCLKNILLAIEHGPSGADATLLLWENRQDVEQASPS